MITVLKSSATKEQRDHLISWLQDQGLQVHVSEGSEYTILGLVGDTAHIDVELLESLAIVESVKRVSEPFKKVNRKFHPQDTAVTVGDAVVGAGHFAVIAGPRSVESREQIAAVAQAVKDAGASLLRGSAFRPRTSPYDLQAIHAEGLEYLLAAKRETGLPIVAELADMKDFDLFAEVDVIQVGSRNMQNYEMLRALGRTDKTILLRRGLSGSINDLLMSAEYLLAGGNTGVILCERGIRTFETTTKNTLDLSAVPVLRQLTHLPVIVDPSHATGRSDLVPAMALAAVAAGADGLMIEVHDDPLHAQCDGAQSLTPAQFAGLMARIQRVREAVLS